MEEMTRLQQIQDINAHIKEGIGQWAKVCLMADSDNWSFYLNYDEDDVMNVTLLFNHVCSNIGIKKGRIQNEQVAEVYGKRIRQLIIDMTGIDPYTVYDHKPDADASDTVAKET